MTEGAKRLRDEVAAKWAARGPCGREMIIEQAEFDVRWFARAFLDELDVSWHNLGALTYADAKGVLTVLLEASGAER